MKAEQHEMKYLGWYKDKVQPNFLKALPLDGFQRHLKLLDPAEEDLITPFLIDSNTGIL